MESKETSKLKFVIKNDRKISNIPGTKTISVKDHILLSSGVSSLDHILGGGLQVGSILLIEEDEFGVFSKYFVKYFLAEGLACKHCLFVGSLDGDTHKLVQELPSPVNYSDEVSNDSCHVAEDLKIAWRYQNSPLVQSAPTAMARNTFGHNFDLTCHYSKDVVDNAEITFWPETWSVDDCKDPYSDFLKKLEERVIKQGHSIRSSNPRKTVLRVAIPRLGSPLWPDVDKKLPAFLLILRKIMQNAYASAVVTIPSSLLEQVTVDHCEHMSDNVIKLVSLVNNPNPVYSEYSGLLTVLKLSSLNTLASHVPETSDWAFKLRRRRFVIEKLHLPPELQESTQREQDDTGLPCGSGKASVLDF